MRILISVAVWGRKYAATFSNYSLASLLSPQNIPRLAAEHDVTCHIVVTAADNEWLRRQPAIVRLERHCNVIWDLMESHGIDPKLVPVGTDDRKYPFLSRLQNLAFARSQDHDAIVFNYADFIWADGSLTEALAMLHEGVDAVLSFCLPVDHSAGMKALDRHRQASDETLNLPARELARIAIDHLHREARLRFWDAPKFTAWPTYLLWSAGTDGVLIRAYHQTVLALRVKHDDPGFCLGIRRGSLDGYFTSNLATEGHAIHATDSDKVMVFSLYHTVLSTILRGESREYALRKLLQIAVSQEQRRFAEVPIRVKSRFTDEAKWENVERTSWALLHNLHQTTPFDRVTYERRQQESGDLESASRRRTLSDRTYRYIVTRLVHSALGPGIKKLMGGSARRLRLTIERWIVRSRS